MELENLRNRFTYHPPTDEPIPVGTEGDITYTKPEMYEAIREHALELATLIDTIAPPCRETSLAITKLEEAVMWANAGIARHAYVGQGVDGPMWRRIV
jgi:hypothetical protein